MLRRLLIAVVCTCALISTGWSESCCIAADTAKTIQAHLDAGEFGPALALAKTLPDPIQKDQWQARIAATQAAAGARYAALQTGSAIRQDTLRSQAFDSIFSTSPKSGRGGAGAADFDALMDLISSTIAPDSWDEVGGPGAMDEFAGGVFADPAGVMRRLVTVERGRSLIDVRTEAADSIKGSAVAVTSELRKVSLPRLERELQIARARGESPSEAMLCLGGIYKIQYVLVYPESGDLVIAGPAGPWTTDAEGRRVNVETGRPVLHLDDLVVTLRNAYDKESAFGCSINPRRENLAGTQAYLAESAKTPLQPTAAARKRWLDGIREALGRQDIVVYGIDARTRAARVIVEADYRMKLIGMGIEEGVLGVPSYLSLVKIGPDGAPPSMNVLRWWFSMNYEAIGATKSRDAFEILGQGVKCQSENEMLTERGDRVHTGKADEPNTTYARNFTKEYPNLARKYPIYADLQNVFDLALFATLIKGEDLPSRVNWEMTYLGGTEKSPLPRYDVTLGTAAKEVETVANYRVIDRKHLIAGVSGGVTVRGREVFRPGFLQDDRDQRAAVARQKSVPKDLPAHAWWRD